VEDEAKRRSCADKASYKSICSDNCCVALRCVALRCAEFPLELVLSQRAKRSETRQDQMSVLRGEESARRRSHQKERPTIQSKVGCK
jgi:hypothetical protein